jgi:hypothetical protein
MAVLLGFSALADGKNSRRRRLKTRRSANDLKAVAALCHRRARIAFFRKPRGRGLVFRDIGRMHRVIRPRTVAGAVGADLVGGGSEGR